MTRTFTYIIYDENIYLRIYEVCRLENVSFKAAQAGLILSQPW